MKLTNNQIDKIQDVFNHNVDISHSGTGTMFFTYEALDIDTNDRISKYIKDKTMNLKNRIYVKLDFNKIMTSQYRKVDYIFLFSSILDEIKDILPRMFDKLADKLKDDKKSHSKNDFVKNLEDFFSDFLPLAYIISKYVISRDIDPFETFLIEFRENKEDLYIQNQKLIFSNILKMLKFLNYRLILNIYNIDLLYFKMNSTNKKGTARFLKEFTISDYYPSLSLIIFANYNFWVEIFSYQEAMARRFFRPINKLIFLDVLNEERALELIEKTFSSLDQMKIEKIIEILIKDQKLKLYQDSFDFISNIYSFDNDILTLFEEEFILDFFRSQFFIKQIISANPDLIYILILRGYYLLNNKSSLDELRYYKDYLPIYISGKKIYIVINPNQNIKTIFEKINFFSKRGNFIYFIYDLELIGPKIIQKYKEEYKKNTVFLELFGISHIVASACYLQNQNLRNFEILLNKGGFYLE